MDLCVILFSFRVPSQGLCYECSISIKSNPLPKKTSHFLCPKWQRPENVCLTNKNREYRAALTMALMKKQKSEKQKQHFLFLTTVMLLIKKKQMGADRVFDRYAQS
jgi:hypothetical protein